MASTFAIIETGGKQYRVAPGMKLRVETLHAAAAGTVVFDKVLLRAADGRVEVGAPYLPGAKIEANVLRAVRGDKKIVFKYHSKTRQHKKKGHRQEYTEVEIR